jgi:protein phosphatase
MEFVAKTDVGKKRANNEDNFFAKKYNDNISLFIVADGLGGYESGEVASEIITRVMSLYIEEKLNILEDANQELVKEIIGKSLEKANDEIYNLEKTDIKYKGMGTTVVAILKIDSKIFYTSIGDSRIYNIDDKITKIEQITIDDTYVNELLKTKVIKEEEAINHPQKHVLTKAIGIIKKINIQTEILDISQGFLILCTDGMTNMLSSEEILDVFKQNKFEDLAIKLVQKANDKGGMDNITVIVVKL